jgi:hypothetical protein
MSRTIKAIERHMTLPVRPANWTDWSRGELGPRLSRLRPEAMARQAAQPIQSDERKLVAEWQRGAEILGNVRQKLRIAFAAANSTAFATLGH